jgi:DNA primase
MAPWVSFDEIKSNVSVEAVLESYGLKVVSRKNDELRVLCPFHSETKPSFCFNVSGKFYCFGCSTKGSDILDFVRLKENHDTDRNKGRRQAAIFLTERFGLSTAPPPRREQANGRAGSCVANHPEQEADGEEPAKEENSPATPADDETPTNPPLKFELKNLDPDHPYLIERGLTKETVSTFGLGYFGGKGTMQGRIVIPIHNEQGELVAYAGRWPGDEGWPEGEEKYKLPKGFYKSHVLYNLHRAKMHAVDGLIICEGFFSLYALWQRGRKNVVAVMGSSVSIEQERLIVETVGSRGRVLLAFDDDDAGRRGMQDSAARLAPQVFVRTVELSI